MHETEIKRKYSDRHLMDLKNQDPEKLLEILEDPNTNIYDLTFAAEYAGEIENDFQERSFKILIKLLDHSSVLVKEGAIIGLNHMHYCSNFKKEILSIYSEKYVTESNKIIQRMYEEMISQ